MSSHGRCEEELDLAMVDTRHDSIAVELDLIAPFAIRGFFDQGCQFRLDQLRELGLVSAGQLGRLAFRGDLGCGLLTGLGLAAVLAFFGRMVRSLSTLSGAATTTS